MTDTEAKILMTAAILIALAAVAIVAEVVHLIRDDT